VSYIVECILFLFADELTEFRSDSNDFLKICFMENVNYVNPSANGVINLLSKISALYMLKFNYLPL